MNNETSIIANASSFVLSTDTFCFQRWFWFFHNLQFQGLHKVILWFKFENLNFDMHTWKPCPSFLLPVSTIMHNIIVIVLLILLILRLLHLFVSYAVSISKYNYCYLRQKHTNSVHTAKIRTMMMTTPPPPAPASSSTEWHPIYK